MSCVPPCFSVYSSASTPVLSYSGTVPVHLHWAQHATRCDSPAARQLKTILGRAGSPVTHVHSMLEQGLAVLQGVELGPLLGRGSYGRVHKGVSLHSSLLQLCMTVSPERQLSCPASTAQPDVWHSMSADQPPPAGRWKGVPIAIKIVDHSAYVGTRVDALRESVLSTSVQHPNVVSTLLPAGAWLAAHIAAHWGAWQPGCQPTASHPCV